MLCHKMTMKVIKWNEDKNEWLKRERGVSFEDVIVIVEGNRVTDIIDNTEKYPNQRVYVVVIRDYIYNVPFVESDEHIFLKTIIPNRKSKKKYLK